MALKEEHFGRAAEAEPALVNQAPTGLGPTGFDPARVAIAGMLDALREAKGLADMAVMSDDLDGTPSSDQSALVALRSKIDAAISSGEGLLS